MVQEVLFEYRNDTYLPTALAGSPWHPAMLHGGAPAGLLAHCLEQRVADTGLQPTRFTLELMRPVPRQPLRVEYQTLRSGKRIRLEMATLLAQDKPVALATALFVQPNPVTVPDYAPRQPCPLPPADSISETSFRDVLSMGGGEVPPGLHTAVRLRPVTRLCEQGEGRAWLALPVDILADAATTPFMRAALMSDFCNGVGQLALGNDTGMINADLTLQLFRQPQSEWIGIEARTLVQPMGIGMVQAALYDTTGLVGQVMQTVMPTGGQVQP